MHDEHPNTDASGAREPAPLLHPANDRRDSERADKDTDDAQQDPPAGPVVYLEVLVFFCGKWLKIHLLIVVLLMPIKAFWLRYPSGWMYLEVALVILCFLFQHACLFLGSFGNKTESSTILGASLGFGVPATLIVSYFAGLQVYLLHIDPVFGIISLALLSTVLLLAAVAGLRAATRVLDLMVVASMGALAIGAVALAATVTFNTESDYPTTQRALTVGAVFSGLGLLGGVGSCCLALRDALRE